MLKNFRALLAAALLAFAVTPAAAQVVTNHALAVGRSPAIGLAAVPVGTDGQVPLGQTSGDPSFKTLSGDVSSVAAGGSVTLDSEIHCLAALTSAADKIAYYTGSGTCALADFPSAQRTYLTTPSSANLRGVLNDETGTGLAYFQGGALGTPSSGTLTNASGLPISGITGLGTGVGTALAVNVGSAGAPVLFNGALGTPSSGTLTSATGLPISTGVSGLGTGIATALAVNTGSAGAPVLFNGAGGTPSSLTLTNATGLPVAGITASTSTPLGVGSIELGHASDTTLARVSAGKISVEGVNVVTTSSTDTLSNKTLTAPVATGVTDNQGTLKLSSFVTSTQITSNQNDYTATDGSNTCSTKGTLRLSSDASRNITGLSCGQAEGDVRILHNVGAQSIVLTNQDTASTAANRFLFGGDMTLAADTSVTIRYDGVTSRWRAITTPGAGGGGGGGVSSVTVAAGYGVTTSGTCTITSSGTCTVAVDPSVLAPLQIARNGSFAVAQRSMPTADNTYGLDGWRLEIENANGVVLTQDTADVPTGAGYAAKLVVGSGNNGKFGLFSPIENKDILRARGKVVSLLVPLKATAGLTDGTGKIRVCIAQFTGTADSVSGDPISSWGAEGTNPTMATNWSCANTPAAVSVTTSWADYKVENVSISSSATNLGLFIWSDDRATTATTDILRIGGYVSFALGSVAPPPIVLAYEDEFQKCLRYYELAGAGFVGKATTGSAVSFGGRWIVPKRVAPSVSLTTTSPVLSEFGISGRTGSGSTVSGSALTVSGAGELGIGGFSGMSTGNVVGLQGDVIAVNADL